MLFRSREAPCPETGAIEPPLPGDLRQETDGSLMQLYQQGSIAAFDELYRRHSPKAYGYIRPRLVSRQQADDVLQSCFLKLHQSRHQFDPAQPFLPWFWSVLRSVHADALRRDLRNPAKANASEDDARKKWESLPAEHSAASTSELASSSELAPKSASANRGPSPDDSISASEILAGLSPDQRRLLELRTGRELSFEEIGAELSIAPATARQRFSRLVKSLKAKLSGGIAAKGARHE